MRTWCHSLARLASLLSLRKPNNSREKGVPLGTQYTTLAPSRRGTLTRLICGTAFALGCSYSSEPYRQADKVGVHGVTVTPQAIEFFAIGETKSLTAKISPSDATDQT